jgi:hypothetical protein
MGVGALYPSNSRILAGDRWIGLCNFYLRKLRNEEVLRIRLSAIRECYGIFAELEDEVYAWVNPATWEGKDAYYLDRIDLICTSARTKVYQSKLFLAPATVKLLDRVLARADLLRVEYRIWKMYQTQKRFSKEYSAVDL